MKIVITGASRGLGGVLAQEFNKSGHDVGVLVRSLSLFKERNSKLYKIYKENGIYVEECDLNNANEVEESISNLINSLKGIDALINNASVIIKKKLLDMSTNEWKKSFDTGINSAFYCTRSVVPIFIQQRFGHIVNIGSLSVKIDLERGISYTGSKQALVGFTTSLISELHNFGIKVSIVHPGAFIIDSNDGNDWKMPAKEVYRACEYILGVDKKAFVEEIVVRPVKWPE